MAQTESTHADAALEANLQEKLEALEADEPMLEHFHFMHLTGAMRTQSASFASVALQIVQTHHRNPERSVALRKLLEGKDAAVRSMRHTQRRIDRGIHG